MRDGEYRQVLVGVVGCNMDIAIGAPIKMTEETIYGEDAQALRKKAGLTQKQLGARWNLTRQQIGRIEKVGQPVSPKDADAYRWVAQLSKHEAI